jgi:MFS superfamily sulfate permease-like transporter
LIGTLEGILIAVFISMLTMIYQASFPPVYTLRRKPGTDVFRPVSTEHPDDEDIPGLLMVRSEGRMMFANAPNVTDKLWDLIHEAEPKVVVIEFSGIPDLEHTALNLLAELEEQSQVEGIILWLAALNPEPLRVIRHSSLGTILVNDRLSLNLELAVETYQTQKSECND